MKKTRKIKFTLGMKIASVLCCVALLSVGFASWWIVQYPTQEQKEGNFTVYSVNDKVIKFDNVKFGDDALNDAEIIFGAPESAGSLKWLGYTPYDSQTQEGVKPEDLAATLSFDVLVDNPASGDVLSKFVKDIKVSFEAGTTFDAAMNQQLNGAAKGVGKPKIEYSTNSGSSWTDVTATTAYNGGTYEFNIPAEEKATMSVQIKFTFKWEYKPTANDAVTNDNPYTYFNGDNKDYTTYAGPAKEILTNVNTIGENNQYVVRLNTTPIGSN